MKSFFFPSTARCFLTALLFIFLPFIQEQGFSLGIRAPFGGPRPTHFLSLYQFFRQGRQPATYTVLLQYLVLDLIIAYIVACAVVLTAGKVIKWSS